MRQALPAGQRVRMLGAVHADSTGGGRVVATIDCSHGDEAQGATGGEQLPVKWAHRTRGQVAWFGKGMDLVTAPTGPPRCRIRRREDVPVPHPFEVPEIITAAGAADIPQNLAFRSQQKETLCSVEDP
jgi:hypothetical protein